MLKSIVQNCWVVSDLGQAIDQWIRTAGVGPFFTLELSVPDALYRGKLSPLHFSVALAQAGPLQIELVQQHSPGPSAYRDVVPEGQSGFHHVLYMADNYQAEVDRLRGLGIVMATEACFDGGPWVCADTRAQMGCMLEIVPDRPILRYLNKLVLESSVGWDGTDPIRPVKS